MDMLEMRMNLEHTKCEDVDCIKVTENRFRRGNLVNTAMNMWNLVNTAMSLRVSKKEGIFKTERLSSSQEELCFLEKFG
jgi:hypothetical protein